MAESESHAGDADAMLDDLGLSRRPSKGGKHFVKKGRTNPLPTPVDPAGATLGDEPVAGPSTAPATYSEPPASSQHVAQLQATVDALAGQMAWFVEKLRGEVEDPPTDAELTDTEELPLAAGVRDETVQAQSVTAGAGVDTQTQSSVSGLDSIEQFYGTVESTGPDIDPQLAKIVGNLVKVRLPDDKLRDKQSAFLTPNNCPALVPVRVNPEIWDKLSPNTKSRDVKSQRTQTSVVSAMLAVAQTADTLVRASRTGKPLSEADMTSSIGNLVDALALLGSANLDVNQRRRDDQRFDLNQAYKGLCKDGVDGSGLLYGDDLSSRIDDINRSNKVGSRLASQPAVATRSASRGRGRSPGPSRSQPYGLGAAAGRSGWLGRFRGAFLEQEPRPSLRGKSHPRRGQRPRTRSAARSYPARWDA